MLGDEGGFLDLLVRENDGLLTAFFTNEMAPKMICEPVDWVVRAKHCRGRLCLRANEEEGPIHH